MRTMIERLKLARVAALASSAYSFSCYLAAPRRTAEGRCGVSKKGNVNGRQPGGEIRATSKDFLEFHQERAIDTIIYTLTPALSDNRRRIGFGADEDDAPSTPYGKAKRA